MRGLNRCGGGSGTRWYTIGMKPPILWVGGKTKLADWIVSLMPPHHMYIEPFAGSLAVLFAKNPSPSELVNDLDGDLVNFWRVLRDRSRQLVRKLEMTPYARDEYYLSFEPTDDPLERARRFFVLNHQAFASRVYAQSGWHRPAPKQSSSPAKTYRRRIAELRAAAERLKDVMIEHDDALAVIRRYDADNVCFYVDPPYLNVRDVQPYKVRLQDHTELLETLRACKGKVILSGYWNTVYDQALKDWLRLDRQAVVTSPQTERPKVIESVWLNYDPGILWA
jgi:DNA adenine methylase